jgi:flavin reductase (DIM6/NTAB) family NADH-FMN oxidoreductase RutF
MRTPPPAPSRGPGAPGPGGAVSPEDYRALMASFPTGVAVVTATGPGGRPVGMTCTSLCSVTLAPPTLLVCLRRDSPTLESVRYASGFTVNLLDSGAQAVAELFASGAPDRFSRVRWLAAAGPGGPRLADCAHAFADCLVSQLCVVGDHVVVFGEVCAVSVRRDRSWPPPRPLLYGLRRYARWPGARSPYDGGDPGYAQRHEAQRGQVER